MSNKKKTNKGRKSFRQKFEEARGIKSKEFYPTIAKDLDGVSNIKEAVERVQTVTNGQVSMGANPLRQALRKGCNGRIPKGSSAWDVCHVPRGRPWPQND